MSDDLNILMEDAISLLKELIATPSFSREEDQTAKIIERFLSKHHVSSKRIGNNILALNKHFDKNIPTLLLNSHHDTVRPNPQYTNDPFEPIVVDDKLFGLGSNDAGGCLVSLLATFLHFNTARSLTYNLILAATAEEEISGTGGIEMLLPHLPPIDAALVGEPTLMQMAVAERGLMVLDCVSHGKAGHAAREEGVNALYKAVDDILWFRNFQFPKVSPLLGPNKMSVTVIDTENRAHNVIPAHCQFTVDTRINELYSFEEVLDIIRSHTASEVTPRSMRLRSTSIPLEHPLVRSGIELGHQYYGSPTTSDKALMPFPALKMGPGDSARSHTANEFIFIDEIRKGIDGYIRLLNHMMQ
jgi:acetylornithine deacetylase